MTCSVTCSVAVTCAAGNVETYTVDTSCSYVVAKAPNIGFSQAPGICKSIADGGAD